MKLKDIIRLIDTDEFLIVYGDLVEEIRSYESGSFKAIRKYYDLTVDIIIPLHNSVEIRLK